MRTNVKIIAKKAGVSTATVSRVLNNYKGVREVTRKKVYKIVLKPYFETVLSTDSAILE